MHRYHTRRLTSVRTLAHYVCDYLSVANLDSSVEFTPVIQIRGFAPLLGPSRKAGPSQNARNTAHIIKKGSYRAP